MVGRALRILVLDGYSLEGRNGLTAGGMKTAGQLYRTMLDQVGASLNTPIECRVVFPADDNFQSIDRIDAYDGVGWTGSSLTVYHSLCFLSIFLCRVKSPCIRSSIKALQSPKHPAAPRALNSRKASPQFFSRKK